MALSNLTLCYEGIQRIYRNTVVRHIRERLTRSYGDEAAGRVRQLLAKEWEGIKRNADAARSAGYVSAPLADDFDVLSVSHFFAIFEKFHAELLPAGEDGPRRALLGYMREIKAVRDPMSHPADADLRIADAARVLDSASMALWCFLISSGVTGSWLPGGPSRGLHGWVSHHAVRGVRSGRSLELPL
jgi:hypothetical protein